MYICIYIYPHDAHIGLDNPAGGRDVEGMAQQSPPSIYICVYSF